MKKIIIVIAALVLSFTVYSQTNNQNKEFNKVFTKAEEPPVFPGGSAEWNTFLLSNIDTSILKTITLSGAANDKAAKAELEFIIDEQGKLSNAIVINKKSLGKKLVKELIQACYKSPDWKPAIQNGRKVVFQVHQDLPLTNQ